jgi:hypothetical protein
MKRKRLRAYVFVTGLACALPFVTAPEQAEAQQVPTVKGPGSSTNNGLVTFSGTGGNAIQAPGTSTIPGSYGFNSTDPGGILAPGQLDIFNITASYDNNIVISPGFNQANVLDLTLNATHGNYMYGNGTIAKTTFIGQQFSETFQAAGQRVLQTGTLNCYGVGDCSFATWFLNVAQYPRAGDEGVGYGLASRLVQVTPLQLVTVTGVRRNTCNTTTTHAITGSVNPQTVTVNSGTGCTVGTWVVVNHEAATAFVNHEAVRITASTSNSITATFAANQNSGVTITPAVDVTWSGAGAFAGEGRVVVDITATPYTTGTVSSISGGTFTGSGTGWSSSMLTGGTTIVPGCISLAADDYSSSPYGAGSNTLHDWYQITGVSDATHLGILSFSAAGAANYKGKGPGSGTYTVRPCAEILRVLSNGEAILDTNSFAWATNDQLDISLPPYPDTSGFYWQYGFYSSGGTLRSEVFFDNIGARQFGSGVRIGSDQGPIQQQLAGADTTAYGTGLLIDSAALGIWISGQTGIFPTVGSIQLPGGTFFGQGSNAGSRIVWGGTNSNDPSIGMGMGTNNNSLSINFNGSTNTFGILYGTSTGVNGTSIMTYNGSIQIPAIAMANGPGSSIQACSSSIEGALQAFTDSTTATVGATITGFGTNHVMGRCNGTNWIVASP